MNSFEVGEFCRLCATETSASCRFNIYNNEGKLRDLLLKINSCLPITISEQDNLPKHVCKECVGTLDSFYQFREKTIKSESFLQHIINNQLVEVVIKEECVSPVTDETYSNYADNLESNKEHPQNVFKDMHDQNETRTRSLNQKQKFSGQDSSTWIPQSKQTGSQTKNTRSSKATSSGTSAKARRMPVKSQSLLKRVSPSQQNRSTPSSNTRYSDTEISPSLLVTNILNQGSRRQTQVTKRKATQPLPSTSLLKKPCPIKVSINTETEKSEVKLTADGSSSEASQQTTKTMFQCTHCKLLFQTAEASLAHVKSVHENEGAGIDDSFHFLTGTGHKRDRVKVKRQKVSKKCKVCGKEYARKKELEMHERSHTGEKPYPCSYCNKSFASTSSRSTHIRGHEKRWNHVCSYCGKGFVQKNNFLYHVQKQHTGERPFPCTQCEKKFVLKVELQKHETSMHSTEPRQYFKCDICNKNCTTRNYLRTHIKNHELPLESRKTFKCNICGSLLVSKFSLQKHTLTHTSELLFECDICKKACKTKGGLKVHLLIHSGVKSFVCEICGKAFALLNSLKCHRPTHTGERLYQCEICDQRFTQKSSLNTHRKRHNKDRV